MSDKAPDPVHAAYVLERAQANQAALESKAIKAQETADAAVAAIPDAEAKVVEAEATLAEAEAVAVAAAEVPVEAPVVEAEAGIADAEGVGN
jgi:hypothetical protein